MDSGGSSGNQVDPASGFVQHSGILSHSSPSSDVCVKGDAERVLFIFIHPGVEDRRRRQQQQQCRR